MNYNLSTNIFRLMLTGLTCLASSHAMAQSQHDYRKSADMFYAEGDYYSALSYYQKSLEAGTKKSTAGFKPYSTVAASNKAGKSVTTSEESRYRIAESFRLLHDHVNAEKWYKNCLELNADQYPLVRFWYAMSLRANEKYEEAIAQLNTFNETYKKEDDYASRAKLELANCKFILEQMQKKGSKRIEVTKAGSSINLTNSNYAPTLADGYLVFTSTRTEPGPNSKDPYSNDLYRVLANDLSQPAEKMQLASAGMQQGVGSFASGGNVLFFTRWSFVEGKKIAAIYRSEKIAGNWSEPVKLDINVDGYSSQQPNVTADGKYLLFASNRPGSLGGFDLWFAPLDAQLKPGAAVNMGKEINTVFDEQAPYYHQSSETLVFASNGRVGMGGFDLYESKGDFKTWAAPRNPGMPVNSVKDDMYVTSTGNRSVWEEGYFSSDRSSPCCLEIFSFKKLHVNRTVTGSVVDCQTGQPLAGAKLDVKTKGGIYKTLNTNSSGQYSFEIAELMPLEFAAGKSGYLNKNTWLSAEEEGDSLLQDDICLQAEVLDTVVSIPSYPTLIYFDFNKANIRGDARAVLDSVRQMMIKDPSLIAEMNGYTDGKGSDNYNQKLSDERVKACRDYLIKAGINAGRLVITPNGECCHIEKEELENGEDNIAGREKNRRVEFRFSRK